MTESNFDIIRERASYLSNAGGCPDAAKKLLEGLIVDDVALVQQMQALALMIISCPEFYVLLQRAVVMVSQTVLREEDKETVQ